MAQPRSLRVWVTRAQPGANATAARLRALGHDPLVAPLLEVRALAGADLPAASALAFTSANAVRAFAVRSDVRDTPVFAVGAATAAVARAEGFAPVRSADGDVAALADLIVRTRIAGLVLHPCARDPAGDLVGALHGAGVDAVAVPIYETVETSPSLDVLKTALAPGAVDAVLLHSPRAARALAAVVASGGSAAMATMRPVGLSAACVAPLEGLDLAAAAVAASPDEDALLAALISAWGAGDEAASAPDGDAAPPPGLFPPAFWLALAAGLVCILAGALVALMGPRWFPRPAQAGAHAKGALTAPMVHGKGAGFPYRLRFHEVLVGQS